MLGLLPAAAAAQTPGAPLLYPLALASLQPVLTGDGSDTGLKRHLAKVFLVDEQGGVRNVYSSGFLDPRLLVRDIETLLLAD